ncbi:hypothetical protein [Gloeobacter kilaueensis]|uniref:Uncharacterized protein n=1 Tax=Gloeobacter kilaueensis (strain ATCC BAA-2537 / CCAP 1431/1 / ULC 316 / JS1) TaxID=1183438 RepID=U5QET6_GLOK1|nr:hypothetical protein [Gloeobacter kilaueensis]AGY57467.1 hypothetical protein GKIL_1221 [Gloeobacter kilaueensis JS1]
MTRISREQLNRISGFTNSSHRMRARVILNRFWWDSFGRTYRNSADLLLLNGPQAEALLEKLTREWEDEWPGASRS